MDIHAEGLKCGEPVDLISWLHELSTSNISWSIFSHQAHLYLNHMSSFLFPLVLCMIQLWTWLSIMFSRISFQRAQRTNNSSLLDIGCCTNIRLISVGLNKDQDTSIQYKHTVPEPSSRVHKNPDEFNPEKPVLCIRHQQVSKHTSWPLLKIHKLFLLSHNNPCLLVPSWVQYNKLWMQIMAQRYRDNHSGGVSVTRGQCMF
jgi:hypothetical protein